MLLLSRYGAILDSQKFWSTVHFFQFRRTINTFKKINSCILELEDYSFCMLELYIQMCPVISEHSPKFSGRWQCSLWKYYYGFSCYRLCNFCTSQFRLPSLSSLSKWCRQYSPRLQMQFFRYLFYSIRADTLCMFSYFQAKFVTFFKLNVNNLRCIIC